ncbi:MAG: hypothetical protein ACTSUE_03525 [Promethearchaeota archaeon]
MPESPCSSEPDVRLSPHPAQAPVSQGTGMFKSRRARDCTTQPLKLVVASNHENPGRKGSCGYALQDVSTT